MKHPPPKTPIIDAWLLVFYAFLLDILAHITSTLNATAWGFFICLQLVCFVLAGCMTYTAFFLVAFVTNTVKLYNKMPRCAGNTTGAGAKIHHTRYNIPSAILIIAPAGGKLKEMQVIL